VFADDVDLAGESLSLEDFEQCGGVPLDACECVIGSILICDG